MTDHTTTTAATAAPTAAPAQAPAPTQAPAPVPTTTYARYLQVPALLSLRQPPAAPVPASLGEQLFVTVHQVQELWFAQLLAELTAARDLLVDGQPRLARLRLARCLVIDRTLVTSLQPLRAMSPREFHLFRARLGTASGAQSAQFREIEALSGADWARSAPPPEGLTEVERAALRRRQSEPSLWDGLLAVLAKAGYDTGSHAARLAALAGLAAGPEEPADLAELVGALLDHDAIWSEWRAAHTVLVERQIGARPGTGGTSGAAYLRAGVHRRFFPELWEAGDPGLLADAG
ncbi:tryptophan 2,3-dioxygenase family protein [Streptomyces sp. DSM 44917]|uniref:Tryptophan 2,3-dioxygenase family protein n=1 Tax=Streptomyces boetiae TaxID=3075541 RepID=A0ABU2L6F6_9ACTN|nr:tryptophan 2,3-dioxygenase family protein [Streptomyces sp. DSM 44917]MDT0307150.1 tryptophan 2,3-dioxygenase family protein [Streptomyces sp. DSM 44917]